MASKIKQLGHLAVAIGATWVGGVVSLPAQEALRNAVQGDRAFESRQAAQLRPRDDRMRLGPVFLSAGLTYSLTYDDNVNLVPDDAESDIIHRPQLNLGVFWPVTDESRLSFGLGIGYEYYMDSSGLGGVTITPDSELAWDIPYQDWVVTLYDRVNYSREVISEGGLSGEAEYPRLENTVGFRAQWAPADYMFEFGYSHYNFFAESSDYDYLTRAAEQFFARVAYRFAPITRAGIEFSGSLTDYDQADREDNQDISLGPFVEWQLLKELRITLRGGFVHYTYDRAAGAATTTGDLDSYYANISASHQLTRHLSHQLSLDRSVEQGVNEASTAGERFTANYNVNWLFHRSMSASVGPFFEHSREPQMGGTERYDRFGSTVGLNWHAKEKLQLGVTYRYTNKDSDFKPANNDYEQNSVTFNASYQF